MAVMMQPKCNIKLLFKLSLGILAFGSLSWMFAYKYSVVIDPRIKSPLMLDYSNGHLEYSTPQGITNYAKHSSKNNSNPLLPSHSDVLSSSSGNSRNHSQMEEDSSQGAEKESKLNDTDIDEKVKKSEVDNLVSMISKLSNLNESSSIMAMIRNNLNNLSHTLLLPPEKVKKFEVDILVSIISKLTNINESSSIMAMMRKNLNNLSHIPSLPPDIIKKPKGILQSTVVPPAARVTYSDTWNGYRLPVITCEPNGRLGNVMGEYATMYAIQRLYNVSVVVSDVMSKELSDFPHLSLPKLAGKYNTKHWIGVSLYGSRNNYSPIELAASGLLGPGRFAMKAYAFEIQLFQKYKEDIKQEFTFSDKITTEVQKFLKSVAETRSNISHSDIVFVGFHVRRTDYNELAKKYGGALPGDSYFNRAMDYFRKKFAGRVVFIASSDNRTFVKKKIGKHPDVLFSPGTSAVLDMAVLSSCNHSIITLGSYGFWTGFFAGGEVVYPNTKFKKEFRFSQAMYEKSGLTSFTPLPAD